MKLDELKYDHSKTINYLDTKLLDITSNQPFSFDKQTYADIIKRPLLKSRDKYSHASQFTKHLSSLKLEGNTLLQIQKCWYAIVSNLYNSLSTEQDLAGI